MAMSLEQYANFLDDREDLSWPKAPDVEKPKAKPHLSKLPKVRTVLWNVYGTLLNLFNGELLFEHPTEFVMNVALDKTIQEFKMWASMSRKPGKPSAYMGQIYSQLLFERRAASGGEKYPEVASDGLWEAIVKKLLQKDYSWDTGFYGALNELSQKIAYFFHASLQGTACFAGAAQTLDELSQKGLKHGILADGQCFSLVQLHRGIVSQDETLEPDQLFDKRLCVLSYQHRARKPSEKLWDEIRERLEKLGIDPTTVLHVGSRIEQDLAPAKRLGMKTALFAGDKASLQAKPEQMKDAQKRPDVLLTEMSQLIEILG